MNDVSASSEGYCSSESRPVIRSAGHGYTIVPTNAKCDEDEVNVNSSRKYFWRQFFVSSAIWTPFFSIGICLGTPTVFIAQVRREANSTAAVSVEMASWLCKFIFITIFLTCLLSVASWLSSAFGYASVPWCIILALLTDYIGRKKTFIIVALNQVLVATSYCLSTTPVHVLISEVLHGLTHASSMNVCIITVVEFTSPKNRGLMLTIKTATIYWAVWAANAIGTFTSWRYITILGMLNALYSLTVFFWPESPTWLASRGRFEECRRSHRWLKGCDANSERELEFLINSHIKDQKSKKVRTLGSTFGFFAAKEFYCPVILSTMMILLYQLSGKQVVTMYAIDMLKEITSSESTAYKSMLLIDGVSVITIYIGCYLAKIHKRRFLLIFYGFLTIVFLLSMAFYLYLVHLSYISENKYISISLLVGFTISIGLGPIHMATCLFAEILPLRYKWQASIIIAWCMVITQAVLLKNTPFIFSCFDMHGMFLFYGISVSVCLFVLYKYLPETKDKTLQEIERHFKD